MAPLAAPPRWLLGDMRALLNRRRRGIWRLVEETARLLMTFDSQQPRLVDIARTPNEAWTPRMKRTPLRPAERVRNRPRDHGQPDSTLGVDAGYRFQQ